MDLRTGGRRVAMRWPSGAAVRFQVLFVFLFLYS